VKPKSKQMKNKSTTQGLLPEDGIPGSEIFNTSTHKEYANEGDEFVDDAIRIVEQPFGQIDGSLEVWQKRSKQLSNVPSEIVNSK
jgi:hypothetical protein